MDCGGGHGQRGAGHAGAAGGLPRDLRAARRRRSRPIAASTAGPTHARTPTSRSRRCSSRSCARKACCDEVCATCRREPAGSCSLAWLRQCVLLYLLKPSPRRLSVSSALIWRRVLEQRKRRPERLRWWLSLLLALADRAVGGRRAHAARGGRAYRHRERCRAGDRHRRRRWRPCGRTAAAGSPLRSSGPGSIIAERGAGSRYLVTDTMQQVAGGTFEPAAAALRAPARPAAGQRRDPLVPAGELSRCRRDGLRRTAASSGSSPTASPPSRRRREPARSRRSKQPNNVGITAFEVRAQPADARQHEAYLEITNASASAKHVQVQIAGIGAPSGRAPGRVGRRCERQRGGGRVRIRRRTAACRRAQPTPMRCALDDVAYAYLPGKGRVRVGLVTARQRRPRAHVAHAARV